MPPSIAPPEWDRLLLAAQKNQPNLIRELVAGGVSPSHANGVGQSALHIASLWGNIEAVEALLRAGADCNARNRIMGSTPLHIAAQSHKAPIERILATVDLLLEFGAEVQETDSNGAVPFDYAQRPELQRKLLPQKPELYQAIDQADKNKVFQLLQTMDHLTINQAIYDGKSPLEWTVDKVVAAAEEGHGNIATVWAPITEELWEQPGAESSQAITHSLLLGLQNVYKLHETIPNEEQRRAMERMVLLSLKHQKEGSTSSLESALLLHQAARRGQIEMVIFLIEHLGIDPDYRNRQGMTPLQFAARSGQVVIVQYLLRLNTETTIGPIDVNAKNDMGQTAIDAARVNDKLQVVRLLEQHVKRTSETMKIASLVNTAE